MNQHFDVIILGLGGMGSAVAAHLAARGQRVLGLEQFKSPHDQGSSHGKSRVIRQAYYEDPAYVPLLLRAYELWQQLERDSGKNLLTLTGGLMLGTAESAVFAGSLRSAREHGLAHEVLDAREIRKRFPPFTPEAATLGLFEQNAGVVRPEEAIRAHLVLAARRGAALQFEEKGHRLESFRRLCAHHNGARKLRSRTTHYLRRAMAGQRAGGPGAAIARGTAGAILV